MDVETKPQVHSLDRKKGDFPMSTVTVQVSDHIISPAFARASREALGLSPAGFANLARVSEADVTKFEAGQDTRADLAIAMALSVKGFVWRPS